MSRCTNHKRELRKTNKQSGLLWFFTNNKNITGKVIWIFVAIFGVLYLGGVNSTAIMGFEIKNLEKHVLELKEEQKKIQVKIVEKRSLSAIKEKIDDTKMVASSGIEYISPQNFIVVVNKAGE